MIQQNLDYIDTIQATALHLPDVDDLPDSDDTPVDNEDQNWLPNLLLLILKDIWGIRQDWYFGVDMGIYHTTGTNPRIPIVPDAFLALNVPRRRDNKSRRSYITWIENHIPPILTIEHVSWSPGSEYDEKMELYRNLGVLYYIIYNPEYHTRDKHQPFEVYRLTQGQYILQTGEPYWMPEIGLGIGRFTSPHIGGPDEGLCWFNQQGTRYLLPTENTEQANLQAQQANLRAQQETERTRQTVKNLIALGLPIPQIAQITNLTNDQIDEILQ